MKSTGTLGRIGRNSRANSDPVITGMFMSTIASACPRKTADYGERGLPVLRLEHGEPGGLERAGDDRAHAVFVVDNQDGGGWHGYQLGV